MSDYLTEITHAAECVIPLIWQERLRFREMESEISSLTKQSSYNYSRAEFVAMNAEDPEDVAMATGMYFENYFGADKDRYYKEEDLEKLNAQIAVHDFSIRSLAGSVLQFAKQGISLVHGGLSACPNGRSIGSQFLKNVIWQGRNQSIHWEEGSLRTAVQECFDKLAKEFAPSFGDYMTRNLASDIVQMFGWTDFDKFKEDMLLLA